MTTLAFLWPKVQPQQPPVATPVEIRLRAEIKEYARRHAELEEYVSSCEFLPALLNALDCGDWEEVYQQMKSASSTDP